MTDVTATEITLPPGWDGPPSHYHDCDETLYAIDGELTLRSGEESVTIVAGAAVFVPRAAHYTLANDGTRAVRCLVVGTRSSAPGTDAVVAPPVPDGRPRVLLHGDQTGGAIGLVDSVVPAGSDGPFLHAHDFAETFYIVEGELTFQLHDELVTATAGEIVVAPGGAPHTFANHSGADARFAMAITPAGFERHFARIAARRAETEPPDWALGAIPDVERVGPQISG